MDEAGLGLEFGLGHHEGPGLADALQIGTRRVLIESRLMGGQGGGAFFGGVFRVLTRSSHTRLGV